MSLKVVADAPESASAKTSLAAADRTEQLPVVGPGVEDVPVDAGLRDTETSVQHTRWIAHRIGLNGYAIALVTLVGYLIALAASKTALAQVHWVFGSGRVALVWLVLITAIIGWLLGMGANARFTWLTSRSRGSSRSRRDR